MVEAVLEITIRNKQANLTYIKSIGFYSRYTRFLNHPHEKRAKFKGNL